MKFIQAGCLLLLLAACSSPSGGHPPGQDNRARPASEDRPWFAALRALDPSDTADPADDITAVYLRQADDRFQIRVDLLDFGNAQDLSLTIKIGDDSQPAAAPLTIHIPSEENSARIHLDPLLATVTVELPRAGLAARPRVDVSTREDGVTGLALDGPVPAQAAPVLLAFYDTFAARFPAEALRRWDGAHTGPRGERHGLRYLLDALEEYRTPIVLLDLKKPENLSALDAMALLPKIHEMESAGLLILPEQAGGEALFGLPPSPFTWGGMPSRHAFAFTNDPHHIDHPLFSKTTFIPIAIETDANQPTPDGPSLEVRRALLETALNADQKDLLVLGGSLRDSTWGSPDMVGETLAYFACRPYIHILAAEDLLDFPTKPGRPDAGSFPSEDAIDKLEAHYRNLTQPVLDFVANWKGSPLSSCASDIDKDGQNECVLARGNYIAIFDSQGARLVYLFSVAQIGNLRYQLIGPSWQVASGLSNPSLWDLSASEAADPGAYPGAFADADGPFTPYEPSIDQNTLVFTSPDGMRLKRFQLDENGLQIAYQTQAPVRTHIPLLVEPDSRFTPGWAQTYVQEKTPSGVAWGLENGPMVRIQTDSPVLMRAFNESLSLLAGPEDPDFDYPPGHYVPFPMAIAEVEMQDGYFLRLERLP